MILDIFFDLIAAAGPFTVFYGMGQNSCSGKLLFRGLSSSDNSAIFIEDSYGLTISSDGGGSGVAIDLNEIVYGTGTGITSSFWKVDNLNYAITGAGIINTTLRGNVNTLNSFNSQIIGGKENLIQNINNGQTKDSVILGGLKNCLRPDIFSTLCNSVIAGGTCNVMAYGIENSVILGGTQNSICTTLSNSKSNDIIHSSTNAQIYKSENSNIHSSCDVCMICSCNSFISSSSNDILSGQITMRFQNSSSVISGRQSGICATGSNNSIISSYKSFITGQSVTQSTILSAMTSIVSETVDTNIIGGYNNYIVSCGPTESSTLKISNIIGGYRNLIYAGSPTKVGVTKVSDRKYTSDFTKSLVTRSTIIGGNQNCILFRPPTRAIVCIDESLAVKVGELNSVIGGSCNEINISSASSIIGGNKNKIICENLSAILGGYKNYICAGLSRGVLIGNYVYSKRAISGANSIIGGKENQIYSAPDINLFDFEFGSSVGTSIIGSDCSVIRKSYTSTIMGSVNSKIRASFFLKPFGPLLIPTLGFTISNSAIISGSDNGICSGEGTSQNRTSRETTIISGYQNRIGQGVSGAYSFTTIASTKTNAVLSTASSIIASQGSDFSAPLIKNAVNSLVISSYKSYVGGGLTNEKATLNSMIIGSTGSIICKGVCNSVILASSGATLTWSNTVLVQNLLVFSNTFVATASTNQFISNSATGSNATITTGTITVRHGLITVI